MSMDFRSTIFWLILKLAFCNLDKNVHQDCGKTKSCIFKPQGCTPFVDCAYFMSYSAAPSSDSVTLELLTKLKGPGTQYVAVGFSHDNLMGDDSVTYCLYDENSKHAAGLGFNKPGDKLSQVVLDPRAQNHVVLLDSLADDGTFLCKISQKVSPSFNSDEVRNLNSSYYLLLASGPGSSPPPSIQIHSLGSDDPKFPFVSASPINLAASAPNAAPSAEGGYCVSLEVRANLVRAHGILMIFGWWLLVALAILFARYFRTFLADKKIFGTAIWFNIHRALNILGVTTIASAFVCIFVAACGIWAGGSRTYNHAVLGMTASICAFVQPIIAQFRCHPGESGRWVFNWIHRIIGVGGFCCACAAIWFASTFGGLGLNPDDPDSNDYAGRGMIIFYFVSLVLAVIFLEIFVTLSERFIRKNPADDFSSNQLRIEPVNDSGEGWISCRVWNLARTVLIASFGIIAVIVCVTLACFIALS